MQAYIELRAWSFGVQGFRALGFRVVGEHAT